MTKLTSMEAKDARGGTVFAAMALVDGEDVLTLYPNDKEECHTHQFSRELLVALSRLLNDWIYKTSNEVRRMPENQFHTLVEPDQEEREVVWPMISGGEQSAKLLIINDETKQVSEFELLWNEVIDLQRVLEQFVSEVAAFEEGEQEAVSEEEGEAEVAKEDQPPTADEIAKAQREWENEKAATHAAEKPQPPVRPEPPPEKRAEELNREAVENMMGDFKGELEETRQQEKEKKKGWWKRW